MAESREQRLELNRAESGHDLWAAVEAAQYARLVDPAEPRSADEAERMQALVGFFAECSEQWETKSAADQTVALQQLGIRLAALGELGLSVYWGVTQRRFDTTGGAPADLPVAVLAIARERAPSVTVALPARMGVG